MALKQILKEGDSERKGDAAEQAATNTFIEVAARAEASSEQARHVLGSPGASIRSRKASNRLRQHYESENTQEAITLLISDLTAIQEAAENQHSDYFDLDVSNECKIHKSKLWTNEKSRKLDISDEEVAAIIYFVEEYSIT